MNSYDWIVMITLGLDRWQQDRRPSNHEIELRACRLRHEARKKAAAEQAAQEPPARRFRWRPWRQEATASCGRSSARAASKASMARLTGSPQ